MRAHRDAGESLIEIVMSVLIVSMTVTALVASLATAGNAGTAHRNSVTADVVMRNYAEATKGAVQGCVEGGTYTVGYTPPSGFSAVADPPGALCPPVDRPQLLTLTVTAPSGGQTTMQIKVRTP